MTEKTMASWAKTRHIPEWFRGDKTEKFWSRVTKTETCWNWIGYINGSGYPPFKIGDKNGEFLGHRIAYELVKGPIPEGMTLDHLCRNRSCVNPEHLQAVPNHENLRRGQGFAGINARKTHCKRGHELSGDNLAIYLFRGKPTRHCKACRHVRYEERKN